MRCLIRNKSTFSYCLYDSKEPITDEYGNKTGEYIVRYSEPAEMRANISSAQGESQTEQFGNNIQYDKVIVTDDMNCPINENSVLFVDKVAETDAEGNPLYDYIVKKVAKSLNSISYAISKVDVS